MKRIIFFCVILVLSIFFLTKKECKKKYKVALLQTASHLALDKVKDTIVNELEKKYKKDIQIDCKNGEGSLVAIESIANQLSGDNSYKLYVAIGSPAVQSLSRLEKNRPIVFGAVTDSKIIGIENKKNVCGFLDQLDYNEIINSLSELFENKKIGILYSIGDLSSEYTISQLEKSKLIIDRFGCNGEAELIVTIELACKKSDVLFLPTDNMIASAIKIVIDIANKYNKPIFMTDILLFELGGKYAKGIDYNKQGKEMALAISEILDKKNNPEGVRIKKSKSSGLLKR